MEKQFGVEANNVLQVAVCSTLTHKGSFTNNKRIFQNEFQIFEMQKRKLYFVRSFILKMQHKCVSSQTRKTPAHV